MPSDEYVLKLTPQDLQVLNQALGELQYKLAAPLIAKINKQIKEQENDPSSK